MRSAGPVRAVHAVSTGRGWQHREHRRGSRLPRLIWALASRSWIEVPIYFFVVEHREGLVLFDTGLDPAIASDPHYVAGPIGRFFLRRLFRIRIAPEDGLAPQLAALGYAAEQVRTVVVSHLHFDHIGGIAAVPQAELLVGEAEWAQLSGPHPERDFILREHIALPGARWRQVGFAPSDDPLLADFAGTYDLLGDGTLVLLPTPGHTPGSLSMLLRAPGWPPLLFVADLTYEAALLLQDRLPGIGDPARLRASFAQVRALKAALPDLVILAAHDPAAGAALRAAT